MGGAWKSKISVSESVKNYVKNWNNSTAKLTEKTIDEETGILEAGYEEQRAKMAVISQVNNAAISGLKDGFLHLQKHEETLLLLKKCYDTESNHFKEANLPYLSLICNNMLVKLSLHKNKFDALFYSLKVILAVC